MDLFERSVATLIESWAYLAAGSPGAELRRIDGAAVAAFVHQPDREFLNNAVLTRPPANLVMTLGEIESTYARRAIERFAIWVHESDAETQAALRERGYSFDAATRTMAMPLDPTAADDPAVGRPAADLRTTAAAPPVEIAEADPAEFWAIDDDGLDGLVPDLDPSGAYFYVARSDGESVAMLMAFDHDGDCGIFMVGTRKAARRRGIATALSAHAVTAARERGCTTASLQATEMAERVYARVGFRDLGRWLEYVPAATATAPPAG